MSFSNCHQTEWFATTGFAGVVSVQAFLIKKVVISLFVVVERAKFAT